ncbi:MAG: TonB-dependent receptor [Bacteroidales bacterium]|nr:TonB-dependent receptor [Bacteroidales bacterium]
MKRLLTYLMLVMAGVAAMAQSYTINGTVTDKKTGETLIGATVMDVNSGKGTVTNAYGYYTLTLKKDSVNLRISYVGYRPYERKMMLSANEQLSVQLYPSQQLEEVVITADKVQGVKSSQMSAIEVPVEQLKAVPVLFGESDILKALQLMPGVQSGSEGQAGMYVRGGGPDENLFLLDGVPLYNVNHAGGFFSAFNSDAVKNVTLYKGSFPAHFGGRLSSVLDITTNNGNDQTYHGSASLGLISAKIAVEGPIIKEKTTFSISARRTYADFLLQPFIPLILDQDEYDMSVGYYFYDLNAKVTHKFSDKSRLYASYYLGDDVMYAKVLVGDNPIMSKDDYLKFGFQWGNMVGSLRWNYVINPKLFMNISGSFTRYRNSVLFGTEEHYRINDTTTVLDMQMDYNSNIHDWSGRIDFDYMPNPNHSIKYGAAYTYHEFMPEVLDYALNTGDDAGDEGVDTVGTLRSSTVYAHEMMAFIEDDWSVTESVKINGGLNFTGFSVRDKFYPSVQPRLSGRILLSNDWSIKVGYAYMTQYLHLLSNSSVSLPTDLWVPVTDKILPMTSNQVAGGVFYSWKSLVDFSVEGYYKRMSNLLEYKEGSTFMGSSETWEQKVSMGDGWAYGVELLAQKTVGQYTGWIGYTWSKAERLFNREGQVLNNGQVFPAKYDRRHDLSIVLTYKPNDRFDCSATFVYSTGNTSTLAMQQIVDQEGSTSVEMDEFGNPVIVEEPVDVNYMESRNNYRLPAYHRMDLSANFHKKLKHGQRTWNVSIYNVYNHQNPYLIYQSYDLGLTETKKLMQLSIFPILPSVSYVYRF